MHLSQIKQALKQDDELFCELIMEKKEKLMRIAWKYCMNETMAEDALAETIYQAYRYKKKCKYPEYFETWLIRILLNCCAKEVKKHQPYNELTIELSDSHTQDIPLQVWVQSIKEPEKTISL